MEDIPGSDDPVAVTVGVEADPALVEVDEAELELVVVTAEEEEEVEVEDPAVLEDETALVLDEVSVLARDTVATVVVPSCDAASTLVVQFVTF